ncbi:hypothetical protein EDC61_101240 [Sulfuritortus calidifontis]|uniref:MAPEG family protein n=1 Tax=Sulfuritortus calidifontis TaxID=1914471 RepID=A0A4R3K153_9PROT|nr:MAPEG family protein [Sulfuritortus calidifontis]TCS74016.1 hypothetical protein EDC61_101240 [Sulfuritortus calidifontis]
MAHPILLASAALVGLTAVVWALALYERIGEMRARAISPQTLATSRERARTLRRVQALDNFTNLFELPVLFYVLCLAVAVVGAETPALVGAAWVFVGLRVVHSLIHLTYNRVMHRFLVWTVGALWLFGMWIAFTIPLLG